MISILFRMFVKIFILSITKMLPSLMEISMTIGKCLRKKMDMSDSYNIYLNPYIKIITIIINIKNKKS